ncbi:MAG: N-acetylmuramoyl-L-alanine amidase, partial [Cyanobacteria bacterium P01_F01_bin.42]
NPTRLVVDLPGTQLSRPTVKQSLAGTVRSVRVGQFNAQTARIVVELAPNYVVDPRGVKVNLDSANSWSIVLPQPQLVGVASRPVSRPTPRPAPRPVVRPAAPAAPLPAAPPAVVASSTEPTLTDISVTPVGLFLNTSQAPRKVSVRRSRSRKQVKVTLKGIIPNPKLLERTFKPGYYGLRELSVRQSGKPSKPETEIFFTIDRRGPSWSASVGADGGVIVKPESRGLRPARPRTSVSLIQVPVPTTAAVQANTPTVQTVRLGGDRLLVQADRPISYLTGWEGSAYRLTVRSAQLAPGVQAPRVAVGSPLSRIQFRQDPTGLSILSTPARGVRITGIQRLSDQQVLLILRRTSQASLPPVIGSGSSTQPLGGPLPRPSGRRVVVIDPGHGGRDPGAIGINGLRETNVVLPISLDVSRILQRQGVTVYLTRTDEREIDLAPRVALAERVRANVFVSIHANAINMSRPDVNGLETYYAPGSSAGKSLAQTIHSSVLGGVNIGSRGVRSARFYVIRRTSMPAALVETGFVTGAIDNPKLANPAFRRQMAEAIARGILQYLARN